MPTLQPNDLILNGTYRIEKQLGQGAFGEVYLAADLELGVLRAIKIVKKGDGLGSKEFDQYCDRFRLEARLGATFHHSNIIHVNWLSEENGVLFLVMDYAPHGSLADQIEKARQVKTPISIGQSIKWICGAAEGLQKLHESDMVHRDIKPSNILLDSDWSACIADLGLVQLATSRIDTGSKLSNFGRDHPGTPEYMPPEQQPGNTMPLRASADVYALGCVLFELLTLKSYYHHTGKTAKSLRTDIPNWLDDIITRALQPNSRDRFQNSEEFLHGIQSRNSSSGGDDQSHTPNTGNKNWILFSIAGLVVIGIIIYLLVKSLSPAASASRIVTETISPSSLLVSLPTDTAIISPISQDTSVVIPTQQDTPIIPNTSTISPPISWKQGKLAYVISQGSSATLNILNLENNSNQVISESTDKLNLLGLAFSSDGEALAFYKYPMKLDVISDVTNPQILQIAACQSPSFSADGSQILCVSTQHKLILVDSSNGSIIKQINQDKYPTLADLSTTTNEISYTVFSGDNSQIWKTTVNGEAASLLAGSATENYAPDWSPDGTKIAYQSNDGSSDSEIWIMDKNGNSKQRITYTENGGWSRAPSWSPDGNYLAYVSSQNGSAGSDLGDVFIVSLSNGDSVQATSTGGTVYDWRVAWGK